MLAQRPPDPHTLSVLLDPSVVEDAFKHFSGASSPDRTQAEFRWFYQKCLPFGPGFLSRAMSMSRPPGLYDLPESLVLAPFMSPLKHKMMEASLNMSATDSAVAHMRDSVAAFLDAVMLKEQPHNREPVFNAIAALKASSCDKTAVLVAQYLVLKTIVRA